MNNFKPARPALNVAQAVLPTAALWLLVWSTSLALTGVLDPNWQATTRFPLGLGLTATLLGLCRLATHRIRARHAAPPIVGMLGTIGFTWYAIGQQADLGSLWPPAPALANLRLLTQQAITRFQYGVPPLNVNPPVVLAVIGLGLGLLVVADLLAHTKYPMLAGALPLFFWFPALGLGYRIPPRSLIAAVGAILLLLAATYHNRLPGLAVNRSWRLIPVGVATAAVAMLGGFGATALANSQISPHRSFAILDGESLGGDGAGSGLGARGEFSNELALNIPVGDRSTEPLFTYTTSTGEAAGPFRFRTYAKFDGQNWTSFGSMFDGYPYGHSDLPWNWNRSESPQALTNIVFQLNNTGRYVPLTGNEVSVQMPAAWGIETLNDTAQFSGEPLEPGAWFSSNVVPAATPSALRQVPFEALLQGGDTRSTDAYLLTQHLVVHDDDAWSYLLETTSKITEGAETPYEIALDIQNYLRNTGGFTYSFDPPAGSNDNMVLNFLEDRVGYCVHFASTMVLMSRTMGIPARLAVGFGSGTQLDDGSWVVSAVNAHSWAELYFGPEIGWVVFDATPASATATPVAYTTQDTYTGSTAYQYSDDWDNPLYHNPAETDQNSADQAGLADSGDQPGSPFEGAANYLRLSNLVYLGGALAVVSIALALLAVVKGRAARRGRSGSGSGTLSLGRTGPATAEERILHQATRLLAKRGVPVPPGCTPRQLAPTVTMGWQRQFRSQPPADLIAHLQHIAQATEQSLYANAPTNSLPDADLKYTLKQFKRTCKNRTK